MNGSLAYTATRSLPSTCFLKLFSTVHATTGRIRESGRFPNSSYPPSGFTGSNSCYSSAGSYNSEQTFSSPRVRLNMSSEDLHDCQYTTSPPTSYTTTLPTPFTLRKPLSTAKYTAATGSVVTKQFRMHLAADDTKFDPSTAWNAYIAVLESSDPHLLSSQELLTFASRTLAVINNGSSIGSSKEVVQEWGRRLAYLLRHMSSRLNSSSPDHVRRLCLLAYAEGLQARFDEAFAEIRTARLFSSCPNDEKQTTQILAALVKLARRFLTGQQALKMVLRHWDLFSSRNMSLDYNRALRSAIQDITNSATDLLSTLDGVAIQDHVRLEAGCQIIAGFNRKGLAIEAFRILKYLESRNLAIPLHQKLYLARALVRNNALKTATELYLSLPDDTRDPFYMTTGLYVLSQSGEIDKARKYYDHLEQAGLCRVSDVTTMMHGYTTQGRLEEAVDIFNGYFPLGEAGKRLNNPDLQSYTVMISVAAKKGDVGRINQCLQEMVAAGIHPDATIFTMIMRAFAQRGDVGSVMKILSQMETAGLSPTNITYTIIIAMLAARKDAITAEAVFKHAVCRGVKPDLIMINAVMNAHVEARSWKGVIRTFDYLKANHHPFGINIYNTVLKAYVLIGTPFKIVFKLYKRLLKARVKPDPYTYALLAQSACNSGNMDAASRILELTETQLWGHKRDMVGRHIRSIILSGYMRQGDLKRATEVYRDMVSRGVSLSITAIASIVRAYAMVGTTESIRNAKQFIVSIVPSLRRDPPKRIITKSALEIIYAPLFAVHVKQLNTKGAERLYQHMLNNGGEPNITSLTALMDVYRRTSNVEAIARIWPQILNLGLSSATVNDEKSDRNGLSLENLDMNLFSLPLCFYIDAMSAAGRHVEVMQAWNEVLNRGFTFNAHHWNHMTVALVRAGDIERAFNVVEHVIIPSEVDGLKFRMGRTRQPSTPLLFSDGDEQPISYQIEGSTCDAHVGSEGETANTFDFARSLERLRKRSSSSESWRPHTSTLIILYKTLRRLQSGRLVNPIKASDGNALDYLTRQQALSTFRRICTTCPKSVARVTQFWRERIRTTG